MRHESPDKALVDDLIQETYLKICANECNLLRTFTPRNSESAFGFLKVVATSVAQDFFKTRLAQKRAPDMTASSVDEADPPTLKNTQHALNHAERSVLLNQIDRKLRAMVPAGELQRARTVFWLYYRSGLTASAIASLPALGLTTKGVESLLFRLTRLVREGLCKAKESDQNDEKGFRQAESF